MIPPGMKKKRLNTFTAKRNATIASIGAPKSAADIRVAENKSFAAMESKLYDQSTLKEQPTHRPNKSKNARRGGQKRQEANGRSVTAQPSPSRSSTNASPINIPMRPKPQPKLSNSQLAGVSEQGKHVAKT